MQDIYPTVEIKVIGKTAPFRYVVSLKEAANEGGPTAQAADISTGTYNTVNEVIACFDWELPNRIQELIREKLTEAGEVEFSLQDAYSAPE
jgi:hypothetical protein